MDYISKKRETKKFGPSIPFNDYYFRPDVFSSFFLFNDISFSAFSTFYFISICLYFLFDVVSNPAFITFDLASPFDFISHSMLCHFDLYAIRRFFCQLSSHSTFCSSTFFYRRRFYCDVLSVHCILDRILLYSTLYNVNLYNIAWFQISYVANSCRKSCGVFRISPYLHYSTVLPTCTGRFCKSYSADLTTKQQICFNAKKVLGRLAMKEKK